MCKATLEIFWPRVTGLCDETKADNMDDRDALSSARIGALSGGHSIVTLSDGLRLEYISDDTLPVGYRLCGADELIRRYFPEGVIGCSPSATS